MFKKIYIILIILILNSCAKELELTEEGVFEKNTNKLITEQIKFNEAVSYSFEIINNSPIYGNYIIYEEFNNSKKNCYIPILNHNNSYMIDKIICFELDFPVNSNLYWFSTKINLNKKYNLNEIDIKKIIDSKISKIIEKIFIYNSEVDKKKFVINFPNLEIYNSQNNMITKDATFKMNLSKDLIYFNFEDLILD